MMWWWWWYCCESLVVAILAELVVVVWWCNFYGEEQQQQQKEGVAPRHNCRIARRLQSLAFLAPRLQSLADHNFTFTSHLPQLCANILR